MFNTDEILDIAIRLEKNSEAVYREAAASVSNQEIAATLEWMADEEVKHAKLFEDLRDAPNIKAEVVPLETLDANFLKTLIGGQSFSLDDVDFADIQQLCDLLDVFVESEKDGIMFYEMLMPFIRGKSTRKMLDQIIHEEKTHIKSLKEFITPAPAL